MGEHRLSVWNNILFYEVLWGEELQSALQTRDIRMTDEYSLIPVTPPRGELWHLDQKRSTTQHKITLCAEFSHGKKCLKLPRPTWKHLSRKWIAQHTREKSQEATEGFLSSVLWSWVCFIPIISFILSHMPRRQSVHAFGWRKISFPNKFLQC